MFTQCPECLAVHSIKAAQLRKNHGIFRCKTCGSKFDALQSLSEKAPKRPSQRAISLDTASFWETPEKPASPKIWSAGVIGGLLLLVGQIVYFEHRNLLQNHAVRPWLEKMCLPFRCQLPVYRNINELAILNSALQMDAEQNYRLQAVLANQAGFAQAYPQLKLRLLDVNGDSFAERIFSTQEYLPQHPQPFLAARTEIDINLIIAAPEVTIGGYLLELQ